MNRRFFLALPLLATPADAGERVVVDPATGLGCGGLDPVSYFEPGGPFEGKGEFEFRQPEAIWRFRNSGNRDAFARNPEIYAPRFGGYDPVSIAEGKATAGHPLMWRIVEDRLYLFFSETHRQRFDSDPVAAIIAATKAWPALRATLVP